MEIDVHPENVKAKAEEAYALYQQIQPDGVITEGDDAQVHFVLPYLKDKVAIPVIFAQIYSNPQEFGYPASNVTGIPATPRFKESLSFVRQLEPAIQTVGIVMSDNEITRAAAPFIRKTFEELSVKVFEPILSNDMADLLKQVEQIKSDCDAIFTIPALGEQQVKQIVDIFGKPTFTAWGEGVRFGILAAVAESGVEVGKLAANMLKQAMDGTPVADIPFSTVEFGTRMINVNTLKALGLQPSRRLLTGVELIKTE